MIAPLSREEFLARYWGASFLHQSGAPGRFDALFSWSELNALLRVQPFDLSRLKLYRDGRQLEASRYLLAGHLQPRLKAASLVNCLADGATLIVDSIHDHCAGVRDLAQSCQEALRADVQVNLYAGWRTQKGFDLHRDWQDIMVLQVSGRKQWKVHRPTLLHPLRTDNEPPPPSGAEPAWEGCLEQGDLLYLPRGWWHVACPLDEPSLHLSVTIVPPSGPDLFEWLVTQLRRHPEARMNVPVLRSEADRANYLSRLRELLLQEWDGDLLARFMADWESRIPVPQVFGLPDTPSECRKPIEDSTRIRLAADRALSFLDGPGGTKVFYANGARWTCATELTGALARLSDREGVAVAQLCAELPDQHGLRPQLLALLATLQMGGAIWAEPAGTGRG